MLLPRKRGRLGEGNNGNVRIFLLLVIKMASVKSLTAIFSTNTLKTDNIPPQIQ